MNDYLTEQSLGEALSILFPNIEFIHNKTVPGSGLKNRPDYRSDDLMMIVEFDGYAHYTQCKCQTRDVTKETVYTNMGYKVIRIPYFVQLDSLAIKYYFGIDHESLTDYPHGFISDSCMLPADFNTKGVRYFRNQINRFLDSKEFENIGWDIMKSLIDKCAESDLIENVLPMTLCEYEYMFIEPLFEDDGVDEVWDNYFK